MFQFIYSVLCYFFVLFFKPKVKCAFPCFVSPFFILHLNSKYIELGKSFCGRDVILDEGCRLRDNSYLSGKISIGRYTTINGGVRIVSMKEKVTIGAFCSIATNVIIQPYNHNYKLPTTSWNKYLFGLHPESKGDIIIEDDCWIGANSVILGGIKIGRGSVIGAGSIVTKDVPPYTIVAGNPAIVIKYRFSSNQIEKLENSKWWTWSVEKIINQNIFFNTEV